MVDPATVLSVTATLTLLRWKFLVDPSAGHPVTAAHGLSRRDTASMNSDSDSDEGKDTCLLFSTDRSSLRGNCSITKRLATRLVQMVSDV